MKLPQVSIRLSTYFEWMLIFGLVVTIITVWKYETSSAPAIVVQHKYGDTADKLVKVLNGTKPSNENIKERQKELIKASQNGSPKLPVQPQHDYMANKLANLLDGTEPSDDHTRELNKEPSSIGNPIGHLTTSQYQNHETATLGKTATKNIYFLKVHKTGSTTIYNILCRFAWKYNLRAATYKKRPFTTTYNETLMSYLVPLFTEGQSEKYNIALEHSRYDPKVINKIIYQPITYITMLRHPITWLDSFLHYKKLIVPFGLDDHNAVVSFVNKLNDKNWTETHNIRLKRIRTWMSRLVFNIHHDDCGKEEAFRELGKVIMVGIHDHYDETLILMKRRFNWSFQDVLYAPLRKQSYNRTAPNKTLYNQLCAWMSDDCKLYEYFNRTLEESIKQEGYEMMQEVKYFKMVLKQITYFCFPFYEKVSNKERFDSLTGLKFPGTAWHKPFVYTYKDCALSRFDEYIYRPLFFYRQNPEFGFLNKCPVMRDHHNMCPIVGRLFHNSSNVIEDIMPYTKAYLLQ